MPHKYVSRRCEDPQDVRAGASGGEEWQVIHCERRGGAERPELREQAVRGAVQRGPRHVPVPGGRHHRRGAAQHQERSFLPHNYWQVKQMDCYSPVLSFLGVAGVKFYVHHP